MSPTPPGPALTAPGTASGPLVPTATPMPLGVLALGEVNWNGGSAAEPWSHVPTPQPNGRDIDGNEIVVPPEKADKWGPSVWMETTPGNYKRIASQHVWDITGQNGRYALIGEADTGSTVQGSWLQQNGVSNAATPEMVAAQTAMLAQAAPYLDEQTRGIIAYGLANDSSELVKYGLSMGQGAGMTPQDATRWEWEQQDRQQAQADRLADAEYRQQALAQQAQQAAAAAAAQRRAQAMSLAESILGMQQQQWAQVSGLALPAGSQTAPGWEQGGAVSQMFANQGLPYTPIQAVQTPGVDYAPAYAWAQKLLGGS